MERILKELDVARPGGPWVAGGAVRRIVEGSNDEVDVDLFTNGIQQMHDLRQDLAAKGYKETFEDHLFIVCKGPPRIEITTHSYFDDLDAIFNAFDFTICQFAWDGERIHSTPEARSDLQKRKLRLCGRWLSQQRPRFLQSTQKRLGKYEYQGFEPTAETLERLSA